MWPPLLLLSGGAFRRALQLAVLLLLVVGPGWCCPRDCRCDLDRRGRRYVKCFQGNGKDPMPMPSIVDKVEVFEVAPPPNKPNFYTIGPIFGRNKKLEELHIVHSNLPAIGVHSFYGLSGLQVLNLTHNNLTALLETNFRGLTALRELHLSSNRIESVPSSAFHYLTDLKILNLARNRIRELSSRIFMKLAKLHQLDLSHNPLPELNHEVFKDVQDLRVLKCRGCGVTAVNVTLFDALPELEVLDLADNKLTTLTADLMSPLRQLRELWMDGNRVELLPSGVFRYNRQLQIIDLARNEISKAKWGGRHTALSQLVETLMQMFNFLFHSGRGRGLLERARAAYSGPGLQPAGASPRDPGVTARGVPARAPRRRQPGADGGAGPAGARRAAPHPSRPGGHAASDAAPGTPGASQGAARPQRVREHADGHAPLLAAPAAQAGAPGRVPEPPRGARRAESAQAGRRGSGAAGRQPLVLRPLPPAAAAEPRVAELPRVPPEAPALRSAPLAGRGAPRGAVAVAAVLVLGGHRRGARVAAVAPVRRLAARRHRGRRRRRPAYPGRRCPPRPGGVLQAPRRLLLHSRGQTGPREGGYIREHGGHRRPGRLQKNSKAGHYSDHRRADQGPRAAWADQRRLIEGDSEGRGCDRDAAHHLPGVAPGILPPARR